MRLDEDAPIEVTVGQLIAEVEAFAANASVHACLAPWRPFGAISGVEVTDLFAEQPGKGHGTQVMNKLHELADEVRLPVYTRPSGPDSRRFYERHGYVAARGASYFLVRFPQLSEDEEDMSFLRQQPA